MGYSSIYDGMAQFRIQQNCLIARGGLYCEARDLVDKDVQMNNRRSQQDMCQEDDPNIHGISLPKDQASNLALTSLAIVAVTAIGLDQYTNYLSGPTENTTKSEVIETQTTPPTSSGVDDGHGHGH